MHIHVVVVVVILGSVFVVFGMAMYQNEHKTEENKN